MVYEHAAPVWRNTDAMRVWFDEWNGKNQIARSAYEETLNQQESEGRQDMEPPPRCRNNHPIRVMSDMIRSQGGRWFCVKCREYQHLSHLRRIGALPPAKVRKLEAEQEKDLKTRYEQGEQTGKLAAAYGISTTTVLTIVRRQGGQVRKLGEGQTLFWGRVRAALAGQP